MWFVSSWFHPVSWSDLWNEQVWWLMGKKTCSLSALHCTGLAVSVQFSFSYALKVRSVPYMTVRNPTIPFEQALTLNNTNVVKLFTTSILIVLTHQIMIDWGSNFTLIHSPENFNHWWFGFGQYCHEVTEFLQTAKSSLIQRSYKSTQTGSTVGVCTAFYSQPVHVLELCFSWRAKNKHISLFVNN